MPHDHDHDDLNAHFRGWRGRFSSWFMRSPMRTWSERLLHGSPRKRMYEIFDLHGDEVLIDVGAGSGYYAVDIAKRLTTGRVIAVDASTEMLDGLRGQVRRKRLEERVEVIEGSAEELAVGDGVADTGFSVGVWHHVDDPVRATRELLRTVRPGGKIVIVEWPDAPVRADAHTHGALDADDVADLLNEAGAVEVQSERVRSWVIVWGMAPEASLHGPHSENG